MDEHTQSRSRTNRQALLFWSLPFLFAAVVGGLNALDGHSSGEPRQDSRPTAESTNYEPASQPTLAIPTDIPEPAVEDCGDGTRGTFGECWARTWEDAKRQAASWSPAATPPELLPPAVTVCRDGWISHSTGRGTCSWHGGIAP